MSDEKAKGIPTPEEVRVEAAVAALLKSRDGKEPPRAKSRKHAEFLIKSGAA